MKTGPGMALPGFEWLFLGSAVAPGGFVSGIRRLSNLAQTTSDLFLAARGGLGRRKPARWWCGRLFPFVLVFLEGL